MTPPCRAVLTAPLVLVALLASLAPWPVVAQGVLRPSPSPAAPGDLSKPAFDTRQPNYQGAARPEAGATVVAEVDGRAITLADVQDAIRKLPPGVAAVPFEVLFPVVVAQLVQREALVNRAHRTGLDDVPEVKRRMQAAGAQVLADEVAAAELGKSITESALLARYRRDFADKPGEDEVRLRVIMVPTEAEAKAALVELARGADFATVARRVSKDSSASAGGELGFVTRSTLTPEVGAVAFVLKPGETAAYAVPSMGAWWVMRVDERRAQASPPFAVVREQIRQALMQEAMPAFLRDVMSEAVVREYSITGKEVEQTKPAAD